MVGDWEITGMRIYAGSRNSAKSEKMLRNAGAVWNMNFKINGKFQQDFNMNDPDKIMRTQHGIWHTSADSLRFELDLDTITMPVNYIYKIDNGILTLNLEHPITKNKIVTTFRKK